MLKHNILDKSTQRFALRGRNTHPFSRILEPGDTLILGQGEFLILGISEQEEVSRGKTKSGRLTSTFRGEFELDSFPRSFRSHYFSTNFYNIEG